MKRTPHFTLIGATMLLAYLLLIFPSALGLTMSCYSNASLYLDTTSNVYSNVTHGDCYCQFCLTSTSGFQYNYGTNSCYTFGDDRSPMDLRVTPGSQVCFNSSTSTTSSPTTAALTISPTIANISTAVTGNPYYQEEAINFSNTATLTFLSVLVTVQRTPTLNNTRSYDTIGSPMLSRMINATNTTFLYSFTLNSGQTLSPGQYTLASQFDLTNQVRNASIDTYSFQTGPNQITNGHF